MVLTAFIVLSKFLELSMLERMKTTKLLLLIQPTSNAFEREKLHQHNPSHATKKQLPDVLFEICYQVPTVLFLEDEAIFFASHQQYLIESHDV